MEQEDIETVIENMTMCTDRFYDEMYAQRYRFLKLHRLLRDMRNPELNRDQYNMLYA